MEKFGLEAVISSETIQFVVNTITKQLFPRKIVLFGSCVSGSPTLDSDLDLLIIMESDLPRYKRAAAIRRLFRPAPCAMDLLVYTPEEIMHWNGVVNHIITEVMQTGRIVYERSK